MPNNAFPHSNKSRLAVWIGLMLAFMLGVIVLPGPLFADPFKGMASLESPQPGERLTFIGTFLRWRNPDGAKTYHLQVAPVNNDGPGVNLIRLIELDEDTDEPVERS